MGDYKAGKHKERTKEGEGAEEKRKRGNRRKERGGITPHEKKVWQKRGERESGPNLSPRKKDKEERIKEGRRGTETNFLKENKEEADPEEDHPWEAARRHCNPQAHGGTSGPLALWAPEPPSLRRVPWGRGRKEGVAWPQGGVAWPRGEGAGAAGGVAGLG